MAVLASSDPVDDLSANLAPVRLVVLAGRRVDTADALAERFGVSHRCIVPLAGQPLIARVLRTGAAHPRITSLAVSIERDSFDAVWDALTCLPGRGTVALVEAGDDLASSIRAAARGWEGAIVVTTADHALLSAEAIDAVLAALNGADVALALVPREAVTEVHHAATVLTLPLYEGAFAPCDLYALAGPHAIGAVEVLRGRGGFERAPWRLLRLLGVIGLLRLALRRLGLTEAAARASRRLHLRLRAVVLEDGRQALDVDDDRSYAVVRDVLESEGAPLSVQAVPHGAERAA